MRSLVIDITHGGDVLARRLLERGEVVLVDCYGKIPPTADVPSAAVVTRLAPAERFDLVVMPIHCPDSFIGDAAGDRVITNHQAVGELLSPWHPWFEVTGTKGKTTTCHALAHILSMDADVLLVSSRGAEAVCQGQSRVLEHRVSIAPTTILLAQEHWVGHDIAVLEVSLGGSGKAPVSVITTIGDDYPIANGTRRAFDGKVQALAGDGVAVLPADELGLWGPYTSRSIVTYGERGRVNARMAERFTPLANNLVIFHVDDMDIHLRLPGTFLIESYLPALECAVASAVASGMDPSLAVMALEGFQGVPGRGEVHKHGDGIVVRDRNPGVSAASLEHLLTACKRSGIDDPTVVIEPVTMNVCEKLDLDEVREVCSRRGVALWTVGADISGIPRADSVEHVPSTSIVHCIKEGYL